MNGKVQEQLYLNDLLEQRKTGLAAAIAKSRRKYVKFNRLPLLARLIGETLNQI